MYTNYVDRHVHTYDVDRHVVYTYDVDRHVVYTYYVDRHVYTYYVDRHVYTYDVDVKKKGSVAFSLSTLRNMMCCVRFQGT